jgi:nucleoid-associated protein YgaU
LNGFEFTEGVMTRETKIGLLVGLAFIIVIGILLSDHLTSSTEPPPASLVAAGSNVRETISVPGGAQPAVTPVVTPPQVTPQAPVPVTRDLQPQIPPTAVVQVGPPGGSSPAAQPSVPSAPLQAPQPAQLQPPTAQSPASQPPITFAPEAASPPADSTRSAGQAEIQIAGADAPDTALAKVAQQHGEPIVTVTPGMTQQPHPGSPAQHTNATRQYVAEPGDSVSKMASKILGANTKANRDAIIRLNPSLQQDPNKVIAGQTYQIPTNVAAPTSPAAPTATAPPPHQQLASAGEYWYIVKENDSLWKIASEQLGNPAAISAIKELNKETLKGSDVVHPNMRLRLPAKPLARAN